MFCSTYFLISVSEVCAKVHRWVSSRRVGNELLYQAWIRVFYYISRIKIALNSADFKYFWLTLGCLENVEKIVFLGKCNWYSSYNFFQLYDYNHQVCHRWRFLTKDVRLWKDKIAALGKPVNCFILVVHLKVHVTNQVLLPNLCYVNKVT